MTLNDEPAAGLKPRPVLIVERNRRMFYSSISVDGQRRAWASHGDRIPGVRLMPQPEHDHDDLTRLGGSFARITTTGEKLDGLLKPLEHPIAVVHRTCDPRTVKRHYAAAPPSALPWPDPLDAEPGEDFRRRADHELVERWRRL